MDTTKTSNPSSKADEADDLIEELARLMADDAQINTPSAQPVPKSDGFTPRGLADEGAAATPVVPATTPTPAQPHNASPVHAEQHSASQTTGFGEKGSEPDFDLNQFDLGTPKAEISSVSSDASTPVASPAQVPNTEAQQEHSNAEPDAGDFDFGFGVGPVGSASNQAPQLPASASLGAKSAEPTSDPIADLINAAVSKHDNAGTPDQTLPQTPPAGLQTPDDANRDSFTSPPVFGVKGTPTPPAPKTPETSFGGSMALDEIESLIGDSVNMDTPPAQPDVSAQMAVEGPPLTPPNTAPGASLAGEMPAQRDVSVPKPDSAEAAILQAMAAAGTATSAAATQAKAEIPVPQSASVEVPATTAEPMLAPGRVALPGRNKKPAFSYLVPLAGILVVGAIGLGAYFLLNPGQNDTNVPVLVADGAATRQAPPPAEPAPESVVLNQIDGTTAPTQTESLVSRDDTDGASPVVRQVITADNSEAGLANRRVRTVTVRPDGTIISGEDAVAGGQALPVAQPNLPDLPASAVNTELSSTTVAALPQNPTIGTSSTFGTDVVAAPVNGTGAPTPRPRLSNRRELADRARAAQTQLPVSTGLTTSPQTSAVNLISAPAPSTGSAIETVSIVNSAASAPPVAATTNVANPRALVQLASQRSQNTANATAQSLQSEFGSLMNGGTLIVRSVDLGTRGIYYRVQLPTDSLASANSICNAIKGAGGDCFTRSN